MDRFYVVDLEQITPSVEEVVDMLEDFLEQEGCWVAPLSGLQSVASVIIEERLTPQEIYEVVMVAKNLAGQVVPKEEPKRSLLQRILGRRKVQRIIPRPIDEQILRVAVAHVIRQREGSRRGLESA